MFYILISDRREGAQVMVIFALWLIVVLSLNAGVGILAAVLVTGVLLGVISAILDLL